VIRSQREYWLMLLIPIMFFLPIRCWSVDGLIISFRDYHQAQPFYPNMFAVPLLHSFASRSHMKQIPRFPNHFGE